MPHLDRSRTNDEGAGRVRWEQPNCHVDSLRSNGLTCVSWCQLLLVLVVPWAQVRLGIPVHSCTLALLHDGQGPGQVRAGVERETPRKRGKEEKRKRLRSHSPSNNNPRLHTGTDFTTLRRNLLQPLSRSLHSNLHLPPSAFNLLSSTFNFHFNLQLRAAQASSLAPQPTTHNPQPTSHTLSSSPPLPLPYLLRLHLPTARLSTYM